MKTYPWIVSSPYNLGLYSLHVGRGGQDVNLLHLDWQISEGYVSEDPNQHVDRHWDNGGEDQHFIHSLERLMLELGVNCRNIGLVEEGEDNEREAPEDATDADLEDIRSSPVSWNIGGDDEIFDEHK